MRASTVARTHAKKAFLSNLMVWTPRFTPAGRYEKPPEERLCLNVCVLVCMYAYDTVIRTHIQSSSFTPAGRYTKPRLCLGVFLCKTACMLVKCTHTDTGTGTDTETSCVEPTFHAGCLSAMNSCAVRTHTHTLTHSHTHMLHHTFRAG